MRLRNLLILFVGIVLFSSCKDDKPYRWVREYKEVADEDHAKLESYMRRTYYNEKTGKIEEIGKDKEGKVPLIEKVSKKIIKVKDIHNNYIDHYFYYMILKEGDGESAAVGDSVFVEFKGYNRMGVEFDRTYGYSNSNWFDIMADKNGVITGFREGVLMLKGAKGGMETLADGQLKAPEGGGRGIFIMPSGLGYFNKQRILGEEYACLIFDITLLKNKHTDHDKDGILTKDEIIYHKDTGVVELTDCNENGVPDYLEAKKCPNK